MSMVLRVLLVEDEPPIARMVKKMLEATTDSFKVERLCINGFEAVSALKENDYDVVITDIRMPAMNGIELARWIYENKPNTTVVMLSGYSDFSYAQEAIKYKVFDYLLKPVSKDKLKELTERILKERTNNIKLTDEADGEKSSVVILACAGAYLLYGADVLLPGDRFWTDDTIDDFMKNNLLEGEEYIFFNTDHQSERFVVVSADDTDRQEELVNRLYNSLCGRELPVTLIYKKGVMLKNAGKSFTVLREQLIKKLVLGKPQLICCDGSAESYESVGHLYSKSDIEQVTSAIRKGDRERVKLSLGSILNTMYDAFSTQEEITGVLNVILDTYSLNYPDKMHRRNTSVKKEIIDAVAGFVSREAFLEDTTSIFMTLKKDNSSSDRYTMLVEDIENYLVKNYTKSITNEVLSREFGFVPSYLSRIFKKHKGVSPGEYITKYRIDLAKKILEENPDIMVKEVADMVGFKESYYFSKTFKRETGMWPTEYHGKE